MIGQNGNEAVIAEKEVVRLLNANMMVGRMESNKIVQYVYETPYAVAGTDLVHIGSASSYDGWHQLFAHVADIQAVQNEEVTPLIVDTTRETPADVAATVALTAAATTTSGTSKNKGNFHGLIFNF